MIARICLVSIVRRSFGSPEKIVRKGYDNLDRLQTTCTSSFLAGSFACLLHVSPGDGGVLTAAATLYIQPLRRNGVPWDHVEQLRQEQRQRRLLLTVTVIATVSANVAAAGVEQL